MTSRPSRFYKYRSMDGAAAGWVERTVLGHELYLAPASSFNDPFDLRPVISLEATPQQHRERYLASSRKFEPDLSEAERERQADLAMAVSMQGDEIERTAALVQAAHAEALAGGCGVYCVCEKSDDILMWSHYADQHRGVCLEFDAGSALMAHAHPVRYSDERVPLNPYRDDAQALMSKALLTKSSHWAYECEWRLLDYTSGPGVQNFEPATLTGVIVGTMASDATIERVRSWADRRDAALALYRAATSTKRFELEIAPLR